MWNKWLAIWHEPSSKRLAAALLASVLVHICLFGGFNLSLPAQKETIVIEARLQPLAPLHKSQVVVPKQASEKKPKHKQKIVNPQPAPQVSPAPVAPTVTDNVTTQHQEDPPPEQPNEPPQNNAESEQQVQDEGLLINENVYPYVETYFDIRTKIEGPVEGKAHALFNTNGNNEYQLDFRVEAGGIAGLFLPELIQISRGKLTKSGLQPLSYNYRFGENQNKSRQVNFNWSERTMEIVAGGESKTMSLVDGAQDIISFMYQFMYVAPLQKMQLNITNGKSFREYDYDFVGEETLNLGFGDIQAYHIVHNNTDNDEKVELWLAQEYQFIPVKIRKIDKEGKVYEFTATKIVTTPPA